VRGMLSGPFRYLRSRRAQARLGAPAARSGVSAAARLAA
jgi:hypothetical protein